VEHGEERRDRHRWEGRHGCCRTEVPSPAVSGSRPGPGPHADTGRPHGSWRCPVPCTKGPGEYGQDACATPGSCRLSVESGRVPCSTGTIPYATGEVIRGYRSYRAGLRSGSRLGGSLVLPGGRLGLPGGSRPGSGRSFPPVRMTNPGRLPLVPSRLPFHGQNAGGAGTTSQMRDGYRSFQAGHRPRGRLGGSIALPGPLRAGG
jgi:hypothetical protein